MLLLLAAAPPQAHAQGNLDFEAAPQQDATSPVWRARGDAAEIARDTGAARSGMQSLRLENHDERDDGGFTQTLDARALAGDRLRVAAWFKTGASAAGAVTLRIRVDGGGRLLYIARARARGAADAGGWRQIVIDAPLGPEAERVSFGGELDGSGVAWFDDFSVDDLDARTLPEPSLSALRYVRQALGLIAEHAVTRRSLDWATYRNDVLAQSHGAVTMADAHLAVQYALSRLGDGHSYFMSPRQMQNLSERPLGNARSGRAPHAPEAELLAASVGYLRLPGFAGGEHMDRVEFAENLQALIAGLDARGVCGWILDLRGNEGGNLWPMLAGLGPLLGDGEVGASLHPDGERRSIWYEDGKAGLGDYVQLRVRGAAYRLRHGEAPVAVVLDADTASAAEIIAAAFAAHPQIRSFGETTRGATAATRTFPLMDDAALMLAVASTVDAGGRVLSGPIEPDEPVTAAAGGRPLSEQPAIAAALRWLAARARCGALPGAASR